MLHIREGQDLLHTAGAVDMSAPAAAKKPKPPPEGVERTTQATLRYAFGLPAVHALLRKEVVAATQNVDKFLTSTLAEPLPDGFTSHAAEPDSVFRNKMCNVLGLSLMTKKKKPMAAAFVFDDVEESDGYLVIVTRGDRTKQSEHKLFDLDKNTIDAFIDMVYTTNPKEPCNFHPWFSSILLSFASEQAASGAIENPFVNNVETVDAKLSSVISNSIRAGRVMLAVCLPSTQSTENVLHKLAIDKAGPLPFPVRLQHHDGWVDLANKAGMMGSKIHGKFKEVSAGVQLFAKIVAGLKPVAASKAPAPVAALAAASERSAVVEEDDDELESAPNKKRVEEPAVASKKPVAAEAKEPVSKHPKKPDEKNKSKKEKCNGLYKRSGQSKFIAEAIEGSRKRDEREERETHKFEKKLKKMQDTDDDGSESESESESGKKKKKKKHVSDSESEGGESELSDSDESEEESSEEERSSEEESEEESDDEASATSSDDDDQKPKKHRRLIKAADLQESNGPKLAQTRLNMPSAADSSSAAASGLKRKQASRPPPAKGNRAGVAAQCKLMLDSVDACTGIPLSLMEKVNSLVAELRDGFGDYESDKFPIKKTYALHTATFNLAMTLVNIINANLTPDQKNDDFNTSRRLAVSTVSALLNIVPSLDQVDVQMRESIKSIETLQKMTVAIADDFNASAAKIDSE